MAKSEWTFKSAVELSAALSAKKVSAVELTQDAIGRIERHDGKINAICVRDFDRGDLLRAQCGRQLDRALESPFRFGHGASPDLVVGDDAQFGTGPQRLFDRD